MLCVLSVLGASLDLSAGTSLVFPNDVIRLTDSKGTSRTVYGANFPLRRNWRSRTPT
jgi:hypothetical protein